MKEQIVKEGKLNEVIIIETRRKNGTLRVQQDYEFCPTMAEQHSARDTDLNYLIERFKPDELAAYIHARSQHKQEITGHDFSTEPNLQDAKNIVYKMKMAYEELPQEIKVNFKSHIEFLKFIDNPANQAKMIKLGLLKPKQIQQLTQEARKPEATPTTTQEEAQAAKEKK